MSPIRPFSLKEHVAGNNVSGSWKDQSDGDKEELRAEGAEKGELI